MSSPDKALVSMLVILFLFSNIEVTGTVFAQTPQQNSWTELVPMNVARAYLGVAVVESKIYAIGGSTASGSAPEIPPSAAYGDVALDGFVGTNEEYDPAMNLWIMRAPMPTPRMAFATAVYQGKIYCIGGRSVSGDKNGGYTSVNEVYDPSTNTWKTKAPLPVATGWLIGNTVGGKIYVLDNSGNNYAYDPINDSWTTRASDPAAAFDGYASAAFDKSILVVGGYLTNIYNVETDSWTSAQEPPSSQGGGAGCATIGIMAPKRVYIFGEIANLLENENPDFVRIYNPENNVWSFGADSPLARLGFAVANANDRFYVIGGYTYTGLVGNFNPVATNEEYTPVGYGTPDPSYAVEMFPPSITLLSPINQTYNSSTVNLTFKLDDNVSWTDYSLDGKVNITLSGNVTLTGLLNGFHNVTVYANNTFGNMASQTVAFTVEKPQTESIDVTVTVALVVIPIVTACLLAGFLIYRRNRKTKSNKIE